MLLTKPKGLATIPSSTGVRKVSSTGFPSETSARVGTDKRLKQAKAEGALRYLAGGDKLVTVVLSNTKYYKAVLEDLTQRIAEARQQEKPSSRMLGLIVIPKGKSLNPATANQKTSELAGKRILIRTSAKDDTLAGAEEIQEEILRHYAHAFAHANLLRENLQK